MQGAHLRKYGVQTTINFELFQIDGIDFRSDAVHASGDLKIMKDEGAEANTENGFADEGQGYSIVLSATEMQAARIVLYLVDQTATKVWLDKSIIIETYGNASAMHSFDLDKSIQDVNIQSTDDIDLTATQKASVTSAVPTVGQNRSEMDSASTKLAAIFTDTDIDIPALIAALNNISSSDILSTALTEAYAADGSTATLSQLLYMIWSMMNSLGFILTTGTARKLDGTTEAMTFTIDDADNPTDINRET